MAGVCVPGVIAGGSCRGQHGLMPAPSLPGSLAEGLIRGSKGLGEATSPLPAVEARGRRGEALSPSSGVAGRGDQPWEALTLTPLGARRGR